MAFDKVVRIRIIADSSGMSAGIADANKNLSELDKAVGRISRSFASFIAIWAGRELLKATADMVNQFSEFEFQLALVGRAAGVTGEDLTKLGDSLRQVALDTGFSIKGLEEVALAAGRAGIKTTSEMTNIATIVSKFSSITGVSADTATTSIIKLQKNFGYSAQQIASSIAWAGKEVLATEGDITQAVLRMIDSGKTLGFDFPTLVGLAAVSMESAGQRASRVGNEWSAAIRKLAENADLISTSLGIKTPQAFRELINSRPDEALFATALALERIQDNTQKVNLETKIFGSTGGKVLPYLRENFARVKEVIGGVGDELKTNGRYLDESWGKVSEQLKIKIQKLSVAFDDLKLSVADTIDVPLANVIDKWSDAIRTLSKNIQELGIGLTAVMTLNPANWFMEELGRLGINQNPDLLTDKAKALLPKVEEQKNIDLGKVSVTPEQGGAIANPTAKAELEIAAEATKIEQLKSMWAAYQDANLAKTLATQQTQMEQYNFMIENQKIANASLWSVAGSLRDTFASGLSNMFVDWMKGTLDVKKAFVDLGYNMIKIIIDFLVQKVTAMALGMAMMATELSAITSFGIAAASALAAAAAYMSTITFGAAALAGSTALAGAVGFAKSLALFAEGGWVGGQGKKDSVPALLTPGEYVLNREQAQAMANGNYNSTVNVSMAGALVMDSPQVVEKLYREYLRDRIRQDIKNGRDGFFG